MWICVRKNSNGNSIVCSPVLSGLNNATDSSCDEIIFFTNRLSDEQSELTSFIKLSEKLNISSESLTFASTCPSADLIGKLAANKVRNFMLAVMEDDTLHEEKTCEVSELEDKCCEMLLSRDGKSVMSVCGAHDGLLVLGVKQIGSLCLESKIKCPHYQMSRREQGVNSTREGDKR